MTEVFDRRFWWRHAILPGLLFAAVTLPFEVSDLDLWFSDPFYDFAGRRWTWFEAWWARDLLHRGGRYLIWSLGSVPLLVLLLSWREARFAAWRRTCVYALVCLATPPVLVVLLKLITNRHCPLAMTRYGGDVLWTRLFDFAPAMLTGGQPGRCFPAAHAASALGLLCLYFVGRALGHQRLWLWTLPGLLLGAAFAFGQHVRGTHFFSHNLWSLALCWTVALATYRAFGGRIVPCPRFPASSTAGGNVR